MSSARIVVLAFALALVAAVPRFLDLGGPGFYGDEEITAFAARALAEGDRPEMPSGMPYDRALGYSLAAGAAAAALGVSAELAYRVPAAIAGTLAVALIFALAAPLVGARAALIAAVLLALSEWHVLVSREARMYSPLLAFFLCSALLGVRAVLTGSRAQLAGSLAAAAGAMTFHPLSAFAALPFAVGPLVLRDARLPRPLSFAAAVLVAGVALLYAQLVEMSAYGRWKAARDVSADGPTSTDPWWRVAEFDAGPLGFAGIAIGAALGIWLALRLPRAPARAPVRQSDAPEDDRLARAAVIAAGALAGAFALAAQLYGAALLAVVLLVLARVTLPDFLRGARAPLLTLAIAAAAAAAWQVATAESLYTGVRSLLAIPFPYLWFFGQMFLGVLLLGALVPFLRPADGEPASMPDVLRVFALIALAPFVVVGLVSQWGGMRYLIVAYPFLLLLAAVGLDRMTMQLARRFAPRVHTAIAPMLALAVVVLGVLGGHGIAQTVRAAGLENGDAASTLTFGFSRYPDHRGAGLYVRERLAEDDIVVAEDALQQRWYAGRVDYWLRNEVLSAPFLYRSADGHLREIYANAVALAPRELHQLETERARRIWVITSAEARDNDALALTPEQLAWLRRIEATGQPAFEGADGVSRVYCLNCAAAAGGMGQESHPPASPAT